MNLNGIDFGGIFTTYGYDPDDPGRDRDIPERLLEDVGLDQDDEETE